MTIRMSLLTATVIAIVFAGVTQRSFLRLLESSRTDSFRV